MATDQGSWRRGNGGAPPADKKTPAVQPPPPPVPEPPTTTTSLISAERTQDIYWLRPPTDKVKVIQSRREFKWIAKSRMPVVLRNLAPDSVFDPRRVWAEEKSQRRADAAQAAETAAVKTVVTKKGKKPKEKKVSKKEQMKLDASEKSAAKLVSSDWERLDNAAKMAKKGSTVSILKVQPSTLHGKLRQQLMILEFTMKNDDWPATFDVLWAIEGNPLFTAGDAEASAAKDLEKKEKKDKKKKQR